jgi:protoporphyrinogen oxidase
VRYGVIGAGALGLTVALRLAQRGHDVTVLERDPIPGGLAGSFEVEPGIWLEKFYHHLFRTDRSATRVIEEVGLGDRLQWHRPTTTVFLNERTYPLDTPSAVLRFSPLAVRSRLRLAAGLAYLRVLRAPGSLERQTAGKWMPRAMGRPAFETVWEPLLRGKFGDAADDVSMAWLWARIHCRTSELGYIHGGFHQLYLALGERLASLGGRIVFGAAASGIRSDDGGVVVDYAAAGTGGSDRFDRVVSTLPTALTVKLTPEMPGDYLTRHPAPRALGAHCLVLALDQPLTDVYWIGVNERDLPFLAVVEHTKMVSPDEYGGRHLVYLGNYRAHDDPLFGWSTDEVIDRFAPGIRRLNPDFDRSWVTDAWSFAAPFAQPVVTPAFARTIPGFDTPVRGLYVANMFQVYPYDRGQNYSIELAERLVAHLEP